jgi:hypothetical protein
MIVRVGRRLRWETGVRQAIGDDFLARSSLRHPVRRPRQSAAAVLRAGRVSMIVIETARIRGQRRDTGRKGGKEVLARCTQRALAEDSRRQARWADADDEGFSKQEWNPAQPMRQVDRVRVAKPFEVLAGFLASSVAARCSKARARGLLIGGLGAIGSGRAVEGAVEAAASDDKTPHCNICLAFACPPAASQSRVVSAADAVG